MKLSFRILMIINIIVIVSLIGNQTYLKYSFLGYYNPLFRTLTIYTDGDDLNEMVSTFHHEVGHEVWAHRINKNLKEEYSSLDDNLCFFYSLKNDTKEDFAASYSRYKMGRSICINKIRYFQKIMDIIG